MKDLGIGKNGFAFLTLLLVLGAGCKGKKEEPAAEQKSEKASAGQSIASLLGTEPALFGPFARVELGKTELSGINPAFRDKKGGVFKEFGGRFAAREKAVNYAWRKGRVNEVEFLSDRGTELEASLKKAWGPGTAAPDSSGRRVGGKLLPARYWFSPDKNLRARLVVEDNKATLNFSLYQSFSTIMGSDGTPLFGFEANAPILGAKRADLLQAYAGRIDDSAGKIYFTKREYDFFGGQVLYRTKDDVVTEFKFVLQHEVAPAGSDARAEIMKAFEKKFGPAKKTERAGLSYYRFHEKPFIEIWEPARSPWFQVRVAASDARPEKGKDNL